VWEAGRSGGGASWLEGVSARGHNQQEGEEVGRREGKRAADVGRRGPALTLGTGALFYSSPLRLILFSAMAPYSILRPCAFFYSSPWRLILFFALAPYSILRHSALFYSSPLRLILFFAVARAWVVELGREMQLRRPRHVSPTAPASPPGGIPGRDTGGRGGCVLDGERAPPGVPPHEGGVAGYGLSIGGGQGAKLGLC
jgi:hypothetical protein